MPLDLSSLFLATIDYDDAYKIFQHSLSKSSESKYPPYDIIKINENLYRITLALAGFCKENIEVLVEDNILVIRNIDKDNINNYNYLYKGIANRSFEKKFQLAENIKIKNASFKDGLLNIDLLKITPEKKQIVKINIESNDF